MKMEMKFTGWFALEFPPPAKCSRSIKQYLTPGQAQAYKITFDEVEASRH